MMFDLIWINFAILFIWNTILTVLIVLLNECQKNQEELLYRVKRDVDKALMYVPRHINAKCCDAFVKEDKQDD